MHLNRLAILGVGLLGGSIGLAVRERVKGCAVIGYGHRPSTLRTARLVGAIDEGYEQPELAVQQAQLVILCTPVGMLSSILQTISAHLAPGAVVTDVGSTKASLVAAAEKLMPAHARFVGSHPMAGSEKRGVQFARADLFNNALCITTPTGQTDPAALKTVEEFWNLLGMRTTRLSPLEHDRLLADVSHLPHAVAAALVAMQEQRALELCGKGFLDLTRIAEGDGGLWRDILIDNRENVRPALNRLIEQLRNVEKFLDPARANELQAWLERAALRRRGAADRKA